MAQQPTPATLSPADTHIAGDLYIGLMSGTSMDGVDAVLASFEDGSPRIIAHHSAELPAPLRDTLFKLNEPGHDELARAARASNQLADIYAHATQAALAHANIDAAQVKAIGAHGQTVRHDPDAGYSIQINAPARLAELTGISVIADFRSRDIAAGGQGAPLVPIVHQALFSNQQPRVILNLGGMANITILHPGVPLAGFDTGPANVLLDAWVSKQTGAAYDDQGNWAASGQSSPALLRYLMDSEPWLQLPPPKSTGRHLFNDSWLEERLAHAPQSIPNLDDADIQATLQSLTAHSVIAAIHQYAAGTQEIIVCGGGARNAGLMHELAMLAGDGCTVTSTEAYGIDAQQVEALAFAWLAWAWDNNAPASVPDVTGAHAPRILGCRYPA